MKLSAPFSPSALDLQAARQDHAELQCQGFQINLARGLPSPEQLALSDALLSLPGCGDYLAEDGQDCRNYMGQQGLPEARALFAPMMRTTPDRVVIDGNSSLGMMHDMLAAALRSGVPDGHGPWQSEPIAFLCPQPGYDRHHNLNAYLGIESIPVRMLDDGPDMVQVQALVAGSPRIKGIWCVPKYSNPTGTVYSDKVIEQLASLETAAPDFRVVWDNAYAMLHLDEEDVDIASLLALCEQHGHPNRAWTFSSTSRMTFAGAELAIFAASEANVRWWLQHASERSVGPDKINQLRHVRFLKTYEGLRDHMRKHQRILAPRFLAVDRVFTQELADYGFASWNRPRGGYFICLDVLPGTARRTVELAQMCGVTLTKAGAPFLGGIDPEDKTLRIAPSLPSLQEVEIAARVTGVSARLAAAEKLAAR